MNKLLNLLEQELPIHYRCEAAKFETFLTLLLKWNKTYNLTAIRDVQQMIPLHLLDCLGIIPCIKGPRVLDVGSGAGFPGIPLAICMPELSFTLVESNRKRVQFLETVKHELQLNHVEIWQGRIEQYTPRLAFDTITSRAFSHLATFMNLTRHVCAKDGIWCAMKGQIPEEELKEISHPYEIFSYSIAHQPVSRCCVLIKNKE